jgi:hypothetical protein
MKIETYILFQTQKKDYQRINVQFKVDFTKDSSYNVIVQTTKKFIIIDFFLLIELETKPITFYQHTLKCHNTYDEKFKQEKVSQIFFN